MPNNVFNNSYSTTTLLGQINALHGLIDIPYDFKTDTTINTKRSLFGSTTPATENIPPLIGYFGIGTGGFHVTGVSENTLQPYYPKATNMDLYKPMPIRCKLLSEDLSPAERANYRIRTIANFGGDDYVMYWLKKISVVNSEIQFTQIEPSGVESEYTLDTDNLTPIADVNATPDVELTDTIVTAGVEAVCTITGQEILEVVNNYDTYGGDLRFAMISEMGFYTGVDQEVTGSDSTVYDESIYTQLAAHRCFLPQNMSNSSTTLEEKIAFKSAQVVIV